MSKILYLTDLYYRAASRNYREEDLIITEYLKDRFDLVLCAPQHSEPFEKDVDLIVLRNTGSVILYQDTFQAFKKRVIEQKLPIFNEFTGKGDMAGKQYLIDLTKEGLPVIPTVDCLDDLAHLPCEGRYAIKPKNGADSIGLEFLTREELLKRTFADRSMLIQPTVDFVYEVSFYFINDKFEYALYAPDKANRWKLVRYTPTEQDLAFAHTFISWNAIRYGIQRVDACRTKDGRLLLMEMEDMNPFLSFECLDQNTQRRFLEDFAAALREKLASDERIKREKAAI